MKRMKLFTIALFCIGLLFGTAFAGDSKLGLGFTYNAKCYDADGNFKWEVTEKNLVTTEGKNHILDVQFHGTTQVTTWYIGLIDDGPSLAAADTLASNSWTENTDYSGDRKEWTEGAASNGSMTNSTSVDFTMDDSGTLAGFFICSAATGTSAVLYSEVAFTGGDRTYVATDVIKVTATLTSADDGA